MPFQLSPGVNVSEIDLTTIVPAVATTDAAFVGIFQWGPVDEITLVNNQETLLSTFGKPNVNTAKYWFTASNFLDYGNKLWLVRTVLDEPLKGGANNASSDNVLTKRLLIKNDSDYAAQLPFSGDFGQWAARYPGEYGNALKVSMCDSFPGQFSNTLTYETANTVVGSREIYVGEHSTPGGAGTGNNAFNVGDTITFRPSTAADIASGDSNRTVSVETPPAGSFTIVGFPAGLGPTEAGSPTSLGNTLITLNKAVSVAANNVSIDRKWEFYNTFNAAPGTSTYVDGKRMANDEIHVVVSDHTGGITGVRGTVLEIYPNVSKALDAKTDDGTSNYYRDQMTNNSKYIHWLTTPSSDGLEVQTYTTGDAPGETTGSGVGPFEDVAWGTEAVNSDTTGWIISYKIQKGGDGRGNEELWRPTSIPMVGGNNGIATAPSAFLLGYDMFSDPEETDISLVIGGPHDGVTALHIIENIAESRKDCVAFISPAEDDVVGNASLSTKLQNVKDFRLNNSGVDGINSKSSSYAVMDSGWKYQYDKYNDMYRWIPLSADIAGLCVRTDESRDPWWSPAGLNRGFIKNVVKLAWNPRKAHRDELYKNGINPVITMKGQGTVLYGDKTLQTKPSAFDRINVRRLFIVLEKAIAIAAKFTLFEFNDEFTRSQFVNMVEPFLRDVQGRRGIFDFKVVCDETNNTGEVIDRNEFIGDIYIKPARSVNFIQLNFVAVRTGVDFEEIVGKF